ncbi:MAG TPA: hypothetical protein VF147_19040 [Vicinamibacterales bacterium]
MAEVLVEYSEVVIGPDGRRYAARACGSEHGAHLWQGWLEFVPLGEGEPVRTGRETTQPNRQDTVYWATGLTPVYLEGALARTLTPPPRMPANHDPEPIFDGPAPGNSAPPAGESILNPFSVYRKGEALLRNQLGALSAWHLVNIIRAYGLSDQDPAELTRLSAPVLSEMIVEAVRERNEQLTR